MKSAALALCLLVLSGAILPAQQRAHPGHGTIDNPVENFEKLWNEFNDRYAFFAMKEFTWKEIYRKYRPQVGPHTTNGQLFSICCQMIGELQDGHVSLAAEATGESCRTGKPVRLLEDFPNQGSLKLLRDVIDANLKKRGFADLARIKMDIPYLGGHVIEYADNGKYGYLRVNLMYGLPEAKFTEAIDAAVESLKSAAGVIIDVRFNTGGLDSYAYALADRFTDRKRIGHYRSFKDKNGFAKPEAWYLQPKGRRQITKPIALLTSSLTVSAGDVFALAMRQLPHVTIIGENTQGYFSDAYEAKLPNGWTFTLSFQKYFSPDMKEFEGLGVAPDIRAVNTQNDLRESSDPLLAKALEMLDSRLDADNRSRR